MTTSKTTERQPGQGLVLWLTGLSAAGKSTVARRRGRSCGRAGSPSRCSTATSSAAAVADLGLLARGPRDERAPGIAFVADLLSRNGVTAIAAVISPYRHAREQARGLLGERFVEVYVKASVEVCAT